MCPISSTVTPWEDRKTYLLSDGGDPNLNPWALLANSEESGPGFQLVEVMENDDEAVPVGNYVTFNCELFVRIESFKNDDMAKWVDQQAFPSYEAFIRKLRVKLVRHVRRIKIHTPPVCTTVIKIKTTADEV